MGSVPLVRDKVQRILVEDLELQARLIRNGFQVPYESSAVNIIFTQQEGDDDAHVLIRMWCPVLRDVRENPELFRWIATDGATYNFGHACWNPDSERPGYGMVSFDHTLLGDYLDAPELSEALATLASVADTLDDELKPRFGGLRFVDEQ